MKTGAAARSEVSSRAVAPSMPQYPDAGIGGDVRENRD